MQVYLSFEVDEDNPDSSLINLDALLLIFVNGVVQDPGESYTFDGGTSFEFAQPPDSDDKLIYSSIKEQLELMLFKFQQVHLFHQQLKTGDVVQVFKDTSGITTTQEQRTIYDIAASDEVETNLYTLQGVDERNFKPFKLDKTKS